ncbi:MAG: hypothetical protein N4A50_04175 [Vallitalea sp.]|jgi:hypothetical protein|nr:hypothetical protein [Vallitalea sp.]
MKAVIYATPNEAEKLGYKITKSYTLSRDEAKKLRNQYEQYEAGENWTVSTVLVLFGAAISGIWAVIGYGVGTLTAQTISGDYLENLDNDFGELAESSCEFNEVEATFSYRRHGSNDGAYFLDSIKIK